MNFRAIIIGPGKKTEGGITSVIKEYKKSFFWKKYKCNWIETYYNKNNLVKSIYFFKAIIKFILLVPFYKIVHIHLSWKISALRKLPFFFLAKLFGKKTLIHLHSGAEPIIDSNITKIYDYYFNKADVTILLAHSIKDQLSEKFTFKSAKVLYNPCVTNHVAFFKKKKKSILFAGHINNNKGVFDLLLAFSNINKKYPEWKLIIAGSGDIERLNFLIKKYGFNNQVEFLGWIRDQQKDETFSQVSIFCLPSYTEGFPMAVLDAWAYGLPVITTLVGGLPDILKHGENSMVFQPGDIKGLSKNLEELITNEKLREKISIESLKLSRNEFNIEQIAKQVDSIYNNLLSKK